MGGRRPEWSYRLHVNRRPTLAELDVLRCFSVGMTGIEAAAYLGRSHSSVKELSKTARADLRARNITHAVAIAIRAGYIA